MSEETKRPRGGGGEGAPFGMRARNRTVVMDSEKIDSLRSQFERPAVAPSMASQPEPEVDASALDVFGEEESPTRATPEDDGFVTLEDAMGANDTPQNGDDNSDTFDPFAFDDVTPVAEATAPEESLPERDPESGEGMMSNRQSRIESAPKFIRSVPAMTTTPKNPNMPSQHDVFDPFAEEHEEARSESASPSPFGLEDDLDSMFGELPAMEESPVLSPTQAAAPKIVRPGEMGAAHERVIVPPPAPQAPPIHIPAMAGATAPKESQQAPKQAEEMTEPRDRIFWKSESPLVGFLVTYDHDPKGSYVELRQGRLMVSNQRETSGSCLVVLGETISPMHAIMRVAPGGVVQVLDQLSEAGTRVKHMGQTEEEFLSGEKSTVSHGDVIFFGDRKFHVLLVIGEEGAE
jgi:hypothetical protein